MTTYEEQKLRESCRLERYMRTLSRADRRLYIDAVIARAEVDRRRYYNWQYGLAGIPTSVKRIMEDVAGEPIF